MSMSIKNKKIFEKIIKEKENIKKKNDISFIDQIIINSKSYPLIIW